MIDANELTLDHLSEAHRRAIKDGRALTVKAFIDERGFLNWMLVTFERIDHKHGQWKSGVANESQ